MPGLETRPHVTVIPGPEVTIQADSEQLHQLLLGDGVTSFYHQSGPQKGYVKNSIKIWERLWMSWWVLDLRVGSDKLLGDPAETGTVFYTSLKPWRRDESNLWHFERFLNYWGWRL